MTTQEVIKIFNECLSQTSKWGKAAQDEVVYAASKGKFRNMDSLIDALLKDARSAANADEFLREKCGIDLSDNDTGAATGSEMGNFLVKNAESIVKETTDPSTWTDPVNNFVILKNGLKLIFPSVGANGYNLSAQEKFIIRGLANTWGDAALDLGVETTGLDFFSDATVKEMQVVFQSSEYDSSIPKTLDSAFAWVVPSGWGDTTQLKLVVNMKRYKNIIMTDENGKDTSGSQPLDRVLAHEFCHALMAACIKWFGHLDDFVQEGMADIVVGIKDNHPELRSLVSTNINLLEKNLRSELTWGDAGFNPYASGYLFFRYLAHNSADTYIKSFDGTDEAEHVRTAKTDITLSGGGGNDTIEIAGAKNTLIKFQANDGNDSVVGFNATSTLSISGDSYTSQKSGNDVIVTVGKDKITLVGAANLSTVNILGKESVASGVTLRNFASHTLITGTAYNDSIENGFYNTNSKGGDFVTIIGAGDNNHIYNMKGANFTAYTENGNDSVHINQGSTAYITTGANSDYVNIFQSSKVTVLGGNDSDSTYSGGGTQNKLNGESGNDLISFWNGEKNSTQLGGEGSDTLRDNQGNGNILDGGSSNDQIIITGTTNDTIMLGAGDDTVKNSGSKQTVYLVELNGKSKNVIIGATKGDTIFISGYAKFNTATSNGNLIVTAENVTVTAENAANQNITVRNCGNPPATDIITEEVYPTMKALTATTKSFDATKYSSLVSIDGSAATSKVTIKGNANANYFVAGNKGSSITGGAGNDTIYGGNGNDSLSGGNNNDTLAGNNGNDKIYGDAGNDSLNGGKGNDTLNGGAGNDKLTGSSGKDVFVFSSGKDTITDYNASDDKISVASSLDEESYNVSGKNISINYGNNSLTINNGLDKKITFADGSTKTYTANGLFNAKKTAVTLPTSTKTFDATKYSSLVTVDGAAANAKVTIKGNSKSNYIVVGDKGASVTGNNGNDKIYGGTGADTLRGGKGNDSLWGGKGNDTLFGDAGKDIFYYSNGDGKDIIYGFENCDMLKITGKFSGTYNKSKKEGYIKVGSTSNAITLKNFSATTFNVNGNIYRIRGSSFVKK